VAETLAEAQDWLRERLPDGAKCPCCTQFAKVYRRKINSAMAWQLIEAWRRCGQQEFHVRELGFRGGGAELAWWMGWHTITGGWA
jgi:hypothetical protein